MGEGRVSVATVSKRAADLAKAIGLTRVGPIRRAGVQIMERVVPNREITVEIDDQISLNVNPTEDGRWYYFADQSRQWARRSRPDFLRYVNEGDRVVDIGAHIGYHALMSRTEVGREGEVIAFEPNPRSYQKLVENVEQNGFENIETENVAVSDSGGVMTLYSGDKTIRATTVEEAGDGRTSVEVQTVTIDDYLNERSVDFVKVNAEGAEDEVLGGMRRVLERDRPTLYLEIHPAHLESKGTSVESILNSLDELNYDIDLYEDENGDLSGSTIQKTKPFTVVARGR